jgi:hypothetical protein
MLKHRLNKYARWFSFVLESRWSKALFLLLMLLGFTISIVFHTGPLLLIFAFAAWTLWSAVAVLLEAMVDFLNRKLFAAACGFLWGSFIGGMSYLGWRLLIREAFLR